MRVRSAGGISCRRSEKFAKYAEKMLTFAEFGGILTKLPARAASRSRGAGLGFATSCE